MKSIARLLFLVSLLPGSELSGQVPITNRLSYIEAVPIASRLSVGMPQVEVRKALERAGFGKVSGILSLHSAFIQQDPLSGGFALELEYMSTLDRTNEWDLLIGTSLLQKASIRSNGVAFMSITLTDMTERQAIHIADHKAESVGYSLADYKKSKAKYQRPNGSAQTEWYISYDPKVPQYGDAYHAWVTNRFIIAVSPITGKADLILIDPPQ
jgi:hypothetical protein